MKYGSIVDGKLIHKIESHKAEELLGFLLLNREQSHSQPQYNDQFEQLNIKLDRILAMLTPDAPKAFVQAVVDETIAEEPIEEVKVAKKKSSKKK